MWITIYGTRDSNGTREGRVPPSQRDKRDTGIYTRPFVPHWMAGSLTGSKTHKGQGALTRAPFFCVRIGKLLALARECDIITSMFSLSRRISKLEAMRPAMASSGFTVTLSDLDPKVAAIFLARNCDVSQMTLAELEVLAYELQRFTVCTVEMRMAPSGRATRDVPRAHATGPQLQRWRS